MIDLVQDAEVAGLTQQAMAVLASRAKALAELLELGSTLRDDDRIAVQAAATKIAHRIVDVLAP